METEFEARDAQTISCGGIIQCVSDTKQDTSGHGMLSNSSVGSECRG